jgi:hypothetical protein
MRVYAQMGVAEYFLYDPLGDWLDPPLQGYRLEGGQYLRLEADKDGGITSQRLGLIFRLEEGHLVLFNPATEQRLQTAEERALQAEARAKALEQELARLRTEPRR